MSLKKVSLKLKISQDQYLVTCWCGGRRKVSQLCAVVSAGLAKMPKNAYFAVLKHCKKTRVGGGSKLKNKVGPKTKVFFCNFFNIFLQLLLLEMTLRITFHVFDAHVNVQNTSKSGTKAAILSETHSHFKNPDNPGFGRLNKFFFLNFHFRSTLSWRNF